MKPSGRLWIDDRPISTPWRTERGGVSFGSLVRLPFLLPISRRPRLLIALEEIIGAALQGNMA